MPQVVSCGKQVLRILWHTSTGSSTSHGDATRAVAAASGVKSQGCRATATVATPCGSTATTAHAACGQTTALTVSAGIAPRCAAAWRSGGPTGGPASATAASRGFTHAAGHTSRAFEDGHP